MKKTIIFSTLALSCSVAYAATSAQYDFTNWMDADELYVCGIYDSSLSMMTSGGVISMGFFDDSFDLDNAVASGNLASIANNFNSLTWKSTSSDYTWTFDSSAEYTGVEGSMISPEYINSNKISNYGQLIGKTLYIFVGNLSSVVDSTEFALINFRQYPDSSQFVIYEDPANLSATGTLDISLFDLIPGCEGDPNAPVGSDAYKGFYFDNYGNVIIGSRLADGGIQLATTLIPEPTSITLGSLGLALLALKRRRRS